MNVSGGKVGDRARPSDQKLLHLRKLVELEREGTQAKVAKRLGMSASTVTGGLEELSKQLGVSLTSSGKLTRQGRTLAYRCAPLLDALDAAMSVTGTMTRIGVTHYVARNFLDSALPSGHQLYLYQSDVDTLFELLKKGEIDVVLGGTLPSDAIKASGECEIPYRLVANVNQTNFSIARYKELQDQPTDQWRLLLATAKWALSSKGTRTRTRIDDLLRKLRQPVGWSTVHGVAECSDELILLEIVKRTSGAVAILPWGPGLDRAAKHNDLKILKIPNDAGLWPSVSVGASEIRVTNFGHLVGELLSAEIAAYRKARDL